MSPKKAGVKRKGAAKRKLPELIPSGEVLTDVRKNKWKIGSPIGQGGFGRIYSASEVSGGKGKEDYAVKIEPKENGPLFVEMHFMMKMCQENDINNWMKMKKINHLGMPRYVASGSHDYNSCNYRFLVMDKYGNDLWKIFEENNRIFPLATVLQIGTQILDVLEYIHSKGYVHADVKGSNLVLGTKKGTENRVFLIDFGLASRYTTKEFKRDPKNAHNGTIEYTSRDAHMGVMTRRGDLEILAYNMLHWATSRLPWEGMIAKDTAVQEEKIKHMDNINGLLKFCFNKETPPKSLNKYLRYIIGLAHDEEPDYDLCRSMFQEDLTRSTSSKLEFTMATPSPPKMKKLTSGRKIQTEVVSEEEPELPRKQPVTRSTPTAKRNQAAKRAENDTSDGGEFTASPGRRPKISPKRRGGTPNKQATTKRSKRQI